MVDDVCRPILHILLLLILMAERHVKVNRPQARLDGFYI